MLLLIAEGGGEVDEYGEGGGLEEVQAYGAAPQDLPDGGPTGGGAAPAVLTGPFSKARKLKSRVLLKEILNEMKRRYQNAATLLSFPTPTASICTPSSLQSSIPRSSNDVTIVTQCSIDRLPRLRAMCKSWTGAISCAVHVPRGEPFEGFTEQLADFHSDIELLGRSKLDIVLRKEKEDETNWASNLYPINALRNAALDHARTEHVFLLDVDFAVSTSGSKNIVALAQKVKHNAMSEANGKNCWDKTAPFYALKLTPPPRLFAPRSFLPKLLLSSLPLSSTWKRCLWKRTTSVQRRT